MTTSDDIEQAFLDTLDLFDEVTVNELETIWEHTFQRVDENSGNGITDKFFEYSAGVSRVGPDVLVGEGEYLRTKETGKYGAGKPAQPGAAGRFTQAPSGDQDGYLAYYNSTTGIGGGLGYQYFAEGEGDAGGATEAGPQPYVFLERDGEGRTVVPREHWNVNQVSDFDPTDGFVVRWPHAAYGHVGFVTEIGVKSDWESADIEVAGDAFELHTVHVFTAPGETMWSKFDNPIEWNVSGTVGDGFAVEATACHYEGERGREVKRTTGDGLTPQKNGGSVVALNAFPDWTYLVSFRKRTGWESADAKPLAFSLNASANVEVQITIGGDFNDTSYGLPEDTEASESAVEYDLKTWDLATDAVKTTATTIGTDRGRREYYDTIPGDKQTPVAVANELQNVVVTTDEPVALLARPATGTATDIRYAALRNGDNF